MLQRYTLQQRSKQQYSNTAIQQMATASQQVARCTSCTFTMFSVVRSKLSEGIDPFLLSCWACLSHDVLTVRKRQTPLTVSDLLKFIETETESLLQAAKDHAASNVDAEIPVSLCPANLLYKVLLTKCPDRVVPDQPRPTKRPASGTDVDAAADVDETEREDADLEAVEEMVGSATSVRSVSSRRRWSGRVLTEHSPATSSKGSAAKKRARAKSATETVPKRRTTGKTKSTNVTPGSAIHAAGKAKAKAKAKAKVKVK